MLTNFMTCHKRDRQGLWSVGYGYGCFLLDISPKISSQLVEQQHQRNDFKLCFYIKCYSATLTFTSLSAELSHSSVVIAT